MSRRAAAYIVMFAMAIHVIGIPLDTKLSNISSAYISDTVLQAMQANIDASQAFCSANAGHRPSSTTEILTTAIPLISKLDEITVTTTITNTPTLVMTVMDDLLVTSTRTVTHSVCTLTARSPGTGIESGIPNSAIVRGSGGGPPPRGGTVNPPSLSSPRTVHGKRNRAEKQAAKLNSAFDTVSTTISDSVAPGSFSTYNSAQISSACRCLKSEMTTLTQSGASIISTVTMTVTATATALVPTLEIAPTKKTVTKTWATMYPSAILQYVHLGATRTMVTEACVTGL